MTTFAPIFAPPELRSAVDDRAWLAAMLDAERALVDASALAGLVDAAAAPAVAACCRPDLYDLDAILAEARAAGNPVEPLVRAIRTQVGPPHADAVHAGATSQDMLDSAAMLVARRATSVVLGSVDSAAAACARLVETHTDTLMAARTLLQQAVPTTFGLKAAGWLVALLDARAWLAEVRERRLAAQLGGPAGTLSAFGASGPQVLGLYARELELVEPTLPWHTNRVRMAELAGALAVVAGVGGKIGRDVTLLQQTEVGEVREAAGGVSSTMPQKQNPMSSVGAVASARGAAAAASALTGLLVQEHERAAGDWHAEWDALSSALLHAGAAASAAAELLEGLEVSPERMLANLGRSGGLPLAEQATFGLAARLGLRDARAIVSERIVDVGADRTLAAVLAADARVRAAFGEDEIAAIVDPSASLPAIAALVDRALARYAAEMGALTP